MRPSDWKIPHVEPCDAMALDGIEHLSDAELADLTSERTTASAATRTTRTRPGVPDWRHHAPVPSSPALRFLVCP